MFNASFGELLVLFIIGLVVLGPQRLPIAIKTVVGWIRALRSLSTTVQNELAKELKLQELNESLTKVEKVTLKNVSPEIKASMEEFRQAAQSLQSLYHESGNDLLMSDPNKKKDLNDTPVSLSKHNTELSSSDNTPRSGEHNDR